MSKIEMPRDGKWYEPMTKTVPQSIKVLHADKEATDSRSAEVLVIDYQPGNGTRYHITFVKLPYGEAREVMGAYSSDTHLMVLHNLGSKRAVCVGSTTQYYDLHEKLGTGLGDVLPLLSLIRWMAGDMDNLHYEGGLAAAR